MTQDIQDSKILFYNITLILSKRENDIMYRRLEFSSYIQDDSKIHIADLLLNKNINTTVHTHNFYEFFIVIRGEFIEMHNDTSSLITTKSFRFVKPSDYHYFIGSANSDKNILRNIAVEEKYLDNLIKNAGIEDSRRIFNKFILSDFIFESFKTKSEMLLSQNRSINISKNYIFESLFSDILIGISEQLNNKAHTPAWLRSAYNEMKKRENYLIGLQRFIELSGKSQEHLTREMKKSYGVTPSDFINELRLSEAAGLLSQTDNNITDIIFDCGYNNISYFNRLFKSKYNITPSEYRQRNKDFF